jgi:putative transposase
MARKPRLFVSGIPYHVIQRGNNKTAIFFSNSDYHFFLEVLQEAKIKHPCLIYSYCLMPNHFHLLIQPKEKDNVSLLIKLLGAKYVHYVNRVYGRTGTLWEGRFKCSLIDGEQYFLSCLRYIEMNPLRAGIVNSPELYRWSSYRFRAFGEKNSILDFDPWYNSLGSNAQERQLSYCRFFQNSLPEPTWKLIREMTNKGGIVGSSTFKEYIEGILEREIVFRSQGRPKKEEK